MKTKIIEANHQYEGLWGKFLVARFTDEWRRASEVSKGSFSLLRNLGWSNDDILVLDLAVGHGGLFNPRGFARVDLAERSIWTLNDPSPPDVILSKEDMRYFCPIFPRFLEWLYQQDLTDLAALPDVVTLAALG